MFVVGVNLAAFRLASAVLGLSTYNLVKLKKKKKNGKSGGAKEIKLEIRKERNWEKGSGLDRYNLNL